MVENKIEHKENIQTLYEDEIDLKELFGTIWKNKYLIVLFSFVVTTLTILYTISLPNKYKSSIVFQVSDGGGAKAISGGLSSLAGLAGISMGSSSGENLGAKIELLVKDYVFNEKIVKKYNIDSMINDPKFDENFVFTMGFREIYDLLKGSTSKEDDRSQQEKIKDSVEMLTKGVISFSISKKEGFFTLEAEHSNKLFAHEIVNIYLKELVLELKTRDMKTLEKKLQFYQEELAKTSDLELKGQLSEQIGTLLKKKVLSNVNELYLFDVIIDARVPFDDEKSSPKRALIVVVSFVTSIILAIFGVFFREFLRSDDPQKEGF